MATIYGIIENGVVKTDASLDELEGQRVMITIEGVSVNGAANGVASSASAVVLNTEESTAEKTEEYTDSLLEWIKENGIDDPSLPPDFAHEHEHYLYGTPKQG